jgi:hypothetical protein
MNKQILEIQCNNLRDVYEILINNSYHSQLFGDRIDTAVDDPDEDSKKIISLLDAKGIKITNFRLKPVSLENVFIHLLSAA